MCSLCPSHEPKPRLAEAGFTLAEALVSTAILVTVVTITTSLLFSLLRSHQSFLQRTNQYESLRIAAAHIRQDARLAVACASHWSYLQLGTARSDYTEYRTLPGGAGTYDLHRIVYVGGSAQSDEIVGWDILPAIFTGDPTKKMFTCEYGGTSGRVRLQARALPGQTVGPKLEILSFQRSR